MSLFSCWSSYFYLDDCLNSLEIYISLDDCSLGGEYAEAIEKLEGVGGNSGRWERRGG